MKIFNQTRNTILAQNAEFADTFLTRLIGLLNRKNLNPGEALVITHCQQIHMFFMRFPIDVVFVNASNKVIGFVEAIKPFHLSPIYWASHQAIELPTGMVASTKTSLGDQLIFS